MSASITRLNAALEGRYRIESQLGEGAAMTDAELAKFLVIEDEPWCDKFIASMEPEKRATYERMADLEFEIALWQQGLGPKPTDAIILMDRK